jgi:proteasome lid subunit RPN8/RPN11
MPATTTEQLATLQATTVVVHPLVLLSVADHHARSVSRTSHKRVIGALLGQDNGKIINVANSFGIPFEEDDKDSKSWFLDHNYVQEMYDMFRKVNGASRPPAACFLLPHSAPAKERLIGWYHTGPKLRASDQEINDLFKRFVARPLMVIVDVRPQTVGIPTDAYIAVDEIKDVCALPSTSAHSDYAYRMAQKPSKPSSTFPLPSRAKKPKKSVWNIYCAISKTARQPHSPHASPSSSPLSAACNHGYPTSRNTLSMYRRA